MNTSELVEWQRIDPENGLVEPWWTHPFMNFLKTWNLANVKWLEFGAGRSSSWLRSRCEWVDSIEANLEWAKQAITDCVAAKLDNGRVYAHNLREGVEEDMPTYFRMIPEWQKYDVISIDGIFRNECLQWAIDHFKGRGGIIVVDNMNQDYVWISPAAQELMASYEEHIFVQPDHTNHEGRPWNTRYFVIPA